MRLWAVLAAYLCVPMATGADVDGSWGGWMPWTTCSVTCGSGYHVRSKICDNPEPEGGGADCAGTDYDTKPCDMSNCPVDGEWSGWEAWMACTTTCGTGVTFRTRHCDNPAPAYNGSDCPGLNQDFSKCLIRNCPIPGGWTNWGDFGQCSATCGYNVYKERNRTCTNPRPMYGGKTCEGDDLDTGLCRYIDCKDGIWDTWAEWGSCSATCGTSVRFRFRNCTFSARNGTCTGNEYESGLCSNPCPVNGSWSDWGSWARCSATCEHGTTHRERLCANPPALHGGLPCAGENKQTKNCTDPTPCPVNGMWSEWTVWSSCDATCDDGHRLRIRRCSHPPPMYHGKPCVGKDIETGACNDGHCKIDGGWTEWFGWGACSTTCGSGSTSRFRVCSNPKPEYGGDFCDGEFEEFSNCSINPDVTNCTIDGGWGSWGQWGACGVTCGDGNASRTRVCDNPSPHGEGKYCAGDGSDVQSCTNPTPCPVNGGWATWHAWFACTSTCGNGTQTRFRTCTRPKPANGGDYCVGNNDDTKGCTGPDCADTTSFVG